MVELLAVVAMIGILAVVAMLGYRRYLSSARTSEAKDIIAAIRVAEESHRAETLTYLTCSDSFTHWYPAAPDGKRRHWLNPSFGVRYNDWRLLNVSVDAPTTFGFAVVAGVPGVKPTGLPSDLADPGFPTPTEPWYVVIGAGNQDNDATKSYFLSSSFSGEIFVQNEDE
jgi:type IV pilus assembly protein PilA